MVERRIATYPPGALEFNLQAIHDDPIPILQADIAKAQAANHDLQVSVLTDRLADEEDKRERWAVRDAFPLFTTHALTLLT